MSKNKTSLEFKSINFRIDLQYPVVTIGTRTIKLSATEYCVLLTLTQQPNQPISHEEILDAVWGPGEGDRELLRVNIMRLRRKLEPDPANPRYIRNFSTLHLGCK